MKKRNYFCLLLSFLIFCSGLLGLFTLDNTSIDIANASSQETNLGAPVADTTESTSFSVPTVYNTTEEENIYLFKMTEPTLLNDIYTYPTTDLPKKINYARPLTLSFIDLSADEFTYNDYDILSVTISCTYNDAGTKKYVIGSSADPQITLYDTTINSISNIILEKDMAVDQITINNDADYIGKTINVEITITYNYVRRVEDRTFFDFKTISFQLNCHSEVGLNAGNQLYDDESATYDLLYNWNTIDIGTSDSKQQEPVQGIIYRCVTLNYFVTKQDLGDRDEYDNIVYEDVGLNNIKINGTIYQAGAIGDNKPIIFETSGKYTISILSNEYQDGIDKEYTCKSYYFTISNNKNVVAYAKKDGSEIVNFGDDRFQFLNSTVILNFFGYEVDDRISYFYQSGVSGGVTVKTIILTDDIINNGYELSDNGKYYHFTDDLDAAIQIPLIFYICSGILQTQEQDAIDTQLAAFKNGTSITYDDPTRTAVSEIEYELKYSILGLSIKYGEDNPSQNVHTTNTYHYDFKIVVAAKPTIKLSPALSHGSSTTSNIVINEPKAAGNWTMTVTHGNNTKTYTRNNFDNISLTENGKYEITVVDGAKNRVSLTVTKRFSMNFATVALIGVGIIGTVIMTYVIIKSRFALQVK